MSTGHFLPDETLWSYSHCFLRSSAGHRVFQVNHLKVEPRTVPLQSLPNQNLVSTRFTRFSTWLFQAKCTFLPVGFVSCPLPWCHAILVVCCSPNGSKGTMVGSRLTSPPPNTPLPSLQPQQICTATPCSRRCAVDAACCVVCICVCFHQKWCVA